MLFIKWVLYMLYSIVVIHRNLRYIIIFHLVHYWIGGVSRLYLLAMQMHIVTDRTSIFNMLASFGRFQFYSYAICAASGIGVERLFATYFVLDYETKNRTWVIVICCVYLFIHANVFFAIPFTFSNLSNIYIGFYFAMTIISAKSLSVTLYKYNSKELDKLNWKIANKTRRVNILYSISKRFQLDENIRILKLLNEIGMAFVISVLISIFCILTVCFLLGTDNFSGQITVVMIDFLIAGSGIILPSLCVYIVRRENVVNKRKSVANLVFVQGSENSNVTQTYFEELQKSWR